MHKEFLIWSIEHGMWWLPDEDGYTEERMCAGRYSYDDACRIVKGANGLQHDVPKEAMIEYVCESCGGVGEVTTMERVSMNDPHLAPIGTEKCNECQ